MPTVAAMPSLFSSWSTASISTSTLMVSSGGPVRRSASERAPSPPGARGLIVRVSVSGLYWNTITDGTGLVGLTPTMAPFRTRGELGKVVMGDPSFTCAADARARPRRKLIKAVLPVLLPSDHFEAFELAPYRRIVE